ncbi:MAG: hypothetical protein WDO15_14795 [Bacteroidota bacterium]
MSERILKIDTYKTYDDIVGLTGRLQIPDISGDLIIPDNRSINLHNYEYKGQIITPRKHDFLVVKVTPIWKNDSNLNSLSSLVIDGENPNEVLSLRIFVTCERTKWSSEQKKISLSYLTKRALLSFEIPLNDVKGIINVNGIITREFEGSHSQANVSFAPLAIVSTCKELSIQIDEIKEVGGQHFPIGPGNTGDLAFDINGLENGIELPKILYSEDLKEYLTRDDLPAVNASMITALFFVFDTFLKWFVFTCRFDASNKYHKGLVDFFSKYSSTAKEDVIALVEMEKHSTDQVKGYLDISLKLFRGVQSIDKYKKELKVIYRSNLP